MTNKKLKKKAKQVQKMGSKTISFTENSLLPVLYGEHDKHLKLVELEMSVSESEASVSASFKW